MLQRQLLLSLIHILSCINDLEQVPEDGRVTVEQQFANDAYGTYQSLNAKLYAQLSLAGQGGPNGETTDASDLQGFDGGKSNYFRVLWLSLIHI